MGKIPPAFHRTKVRWKGATGSDKEMKILFLLTIAPFTKLTNLMEILPADVLHKAARREAGGVGFLPSPPGSSGVLDIIFSKIIRLISGGVSFTP